MDGIILKSYPAARTRVSGSMESAATRIQPPELESAVGWSQPQLVTSRRNSSQPQDGISRNLYPAAGTQDSRGRESNTTHIQPPERESAAR